MINLLPAFFLDYTEKLFQAAFEFNKDEDAHENVPPPMSHLYAFNASDAETLKQNYRTRFST